MAPKLFKTYSIIPTAKRKELVRVDWRCYAFQRGRKVGLLTEKEVCWLKKYLEERHGFSLIVEEYCDNEESSGVLLEELTGYDDLDLIPVRLNPMTDVEFAYPIFGYVISFPLDNVSTVEDLLHIMENKSELDDFNGGD
jgi:hypothetical protein